MLYNEHNVIPTLMVKTQKTRTSAAKYVKTCSPHTLLIAVRLLSCMQLVVTPWTAVCQDLVLHYCPESVQTPCPFSRWYHPAISSSEKEIEGDREKDRETEKSRVNKLVADTEVWPMKPWCQLPSLLSDSSIETARLWLLKTKCTEIFLHLW